MKMEQFSEYKVSGHCMRPVQQMVDEMQREAEVRRRIYDRWVGEGKLSRSDAHDRLERLLSAWKALQELSILSDLVKEGNEERIWAQVRILCFAAEGRRYEPETPGKITEASFDQVRQAAAAS